MSKLFKIMCMRNSILKFETVDVHKKCVGYSSSVLSKTGFVVTLVGSSPFSSLCLQERWLESWSPLHVALLIEHVATVSVVMS